MKLSINQDCCACSYCYRTCPVDAPYFDGEQVQIDRDKCISCGKCVKVCPMGAIYDTEQPPAPVQPHPRRHYRCDAVIIGAGGSGMTAAVRLAERGKEVIVLEKARRTGSGALHVAGPMQIIDTKWALEAGEPPKADRKVREIISYGQGLLDPVLVDRTVRALPRFFDWLCTFSDASQGFALVNASDRPAPPPLEGVEEPQESVIAGGGMPGSAMGGNQGLVVEAKSERPDRPMYRHPGEFVMNQLFRRAEELGVQILRETPAQALLRDEHGGIRGVLAKDPGGEVEVEARVCLIATGSLIHSEAVKQVAPEFAHCFQPRYGHTIQAYTGDGFAMCQAAGIPVRYQDIWLNITGSLVMPCDGLTVEYAEAKGKRPLMPPDLRTQSNRPESLMVNLRGERYQNEQMSLISVERQMKQPQGISYAIFTKQLIQAKPVRWVPVLDEQGHPLRTMLPPGMPAPPWNEEHMKWLDRLKGNHLIIADTLEELARRAGMDAGTLKDTVERYNQLCRAGEDQDFGKNPIYLKPLESGPFYAVKTFLMSDGAEGGIPIDDGCHVMGADGPMPNLFAAGDNASGNIVVTPQKKKIWITNEFSWALSSGMIAADGMLEQLR